MEGVRNIPAYGNIYCTFCNQKLGMANHSITVAGSLYCDQCNKAQKSHSQHAFMQTWDEAIFSEPLADFCLEGRDGVTLMAHKAILAGKSKVFKTMLTAGMSESTNAKVKITDMTATELKALLDFLYTGKVNIADLKCHGVALYKASHKYDLPLLTVICERFLRSNAFTDVCGVFEVAVSYELKTLQKAVLPYIFSEHFVKSSPPPDVVRTLRDASKFESYTMFRIKNYKNISYLMELSLLRMADHLDLNDQSWEDKRS